MKKELRISHDSVAVDLIGADGEIKGTPIYLKIRKRTQLMWKDVETNTWKPTTVIYNGRSLECSDSDMEWRSELSELLTEAKPI